MVTIIFWTLFLVNRDLIFPKIIEEIIPIWQNHIMHTMPLVSVFVECFLREHFYEKSMINAMLPLVLFGVAYVIW